MPLQKNPQGPISGSQHKHHEEGQLNTAQKETTPLKVDRLSLKRYVMWYIALHILLDNLFLHILTPHLP